MTLDSDTVRRIARLARIRVGDDELDGLAAELSAILGWIEQLGEVDTDDVPPMTSAVEVDLPWRDDAVDAGGDAESVLANAPARAGDFFTVPRVVE